jgi:hypothetical protein
LETIPPGSPEYVQNKRFIPKIFEKNSKSRLTKNQQLTPSQNAKRAAFGIEKRQKPPSCPILPKIAVFLRKPQRQSPQCIHMSTDL